MKTAKEITEYLVNEEKRNEEQFVHMVHVTHSEGYEEQLETLRNLREFMLEWEFYPDKNRAMKGIKDALEWVLKE